MAIKSADQITIVDLTDAYAVMLSSDSIALNGGLSTLDAAQTVTVNVFAYRGEEQLEPSVGTPTCPANVSASVGTASNKIVPVTITFAAALAANGTVKIPVSVDDVTIEKEFSFAIAFKGATGDPGTAATNVFIGNESQLIYCDKDGSVSGDQVITIPFAGYQGTARKACTLTNPTLPTGFSRTSNTAATTSKDGSLVLKVTDGTSLAASGEITLTFSCNSLTFTKRFVYARAQTGDTGGQGPQGNPGTSATSVVCGNEAVTIACDKDGKASAASSIVIPFAGYIGTTRAACTVAYSTLPSGVTLASGGNKAATASADGSLTFSVAKGANFGANATMTGEITLTFTCNGMSFVRKFTWSKSLTGATGQTGPQGDPGEDALTLVVTSSNGTIFKNSAIATTLTAHVYKAGAEVTGTALTALGTIKWYKDGGTTAVATGQTFAISAGDVTNKAVFEARLED